MIEMIVVGLAVVFFVFYCLLLVGFFLPGPPNATLAVDARKRDYLVQ